LTQKKQMVNHKEYYLKTTDGIELFAQSWSNGQTPRALVCLVHGLGDQSGRFDTWANLFVGHAVAVTDFDIRGNGKSQGLTGLAKSYNQLLKDIDTFVNASRKLHPNLPVFIFGHGFGGALAINYVIKFNPRIEGLVVTSPWLVLNSTVDRGIKKWNWIFGMVAPWFPFPCRLSKLFREGQPCELNNPAKTCQHTRISVKLLHSAIEKGHWALKNIFKVNIPFMMIYGKNDQVTSYKACQEYVNNASDKTQMVVWEGCGHNIHNSPYHMKVHNMIVSWMLQSDAVPLNNVKANELVPN
jgi:acylglycerol lipase